MARYESFEAVSQLDTGALRGLLANGDAQEQVWAAWAFALALGAGSLAPLREAVQASPMPGTRRHLVVVLAGLGERDLLQVFAVGDPDAYVRATSCQYIMRTWPDDDPDATEFVRQRLLTDDAAEVKATILRVATTTKPFVTLPELAELASNRAAEVRHLAFELIKCCHGPEVAFAGALAKRLHEEQDRDLLAGLANFCIDGGHVELIAQSALRARPAARALLLDALQTRGGRLSWARARPLADLGEMAVDLKLLGLLTPLEWSHGFPWLARRLAESASHSFRDPEWMFFSNALIPFAEAIEYVPSTASVVDCRHDLEAIRAVLKEWVALPSEEDLDDPDDPRAYIDEDAFYRDLVGKIDAALNEA